MSPTIILLCVIVYSALLFYVVWLTSRNADNESYFIGNKSSKWYLVAYGMIGASLSGVTFMSVPGLVGPSHFSYMMVVFGYLLGYFVIAKILLPTYYRLNLTSIYTYLESRMGFWSYKTGAFYFLVSRAIGASFRLYIVVNVLQTFVFDGWGVPFWVTVATFIVLILLYTYKGGVKTIVWTDTLQTTFMLLAVVISIALIIRESGFSMGVIFTKITDEGYTQLINNDWRSKSYYLKHFFGGMFIAIAMTGLDQEMMQKNISVKTLKDSQKNMYTFSIVLVFINLLFLFLGSLLYVFAGAKGIAIPARSTDDLFPVIALNYLGMVAAVFFIIGLISAAYPSADGALTALTSSFCIDFLGMRKRNWTEKKQKNVRYMVHLSFAVLLLLLIVLFRIINDDAVISKLFTIAGYTYGPLLGLFAFGLLSKKSVKDSWVPVICIISPLLCYFINDHSMQWFNGYKFGFELLIVNGGLTYLGLYLISFNMKRIPALLFMLYALTCTGFQSVDPEIIKKDGKNYILYEVNKGDSWFSIARKFDITYAELRVANKDNDDKLSPGKKILIPANTLKSNDPFLGKNHLDKAEPASDVLHVVTTSQTLFSISKKYGITVDQIKQWNNLSSNTISVGQKLIVGKGHPKEKKNADEKVIHEINRASEGNKDQRKTDPDSSMISSKTETTTIIKKVEISTAPVESKGDSSSGASGVEINDPAGEKVIFSNGRKEVNENGIAVVSEDDESTTDKYFAYHPSAPIGTIIRVLNINNSKKIYVKVIGKLSDTGGFDGAIIKISKASAEKLEATERSFQVNLMYGVNKE